jgi:lipid-binding SYLF domain-containing protein
MSMRRILIVAAAGALKDDAYAFIFDQKGLMAGINIEGTKVSKIKR